MTMLIVITAVIQRCLRNAVLSYLPLGKLRHRADKNICPLPNHHVPELGLEPSSMARETTINPTFPSRTRLGNGPCSWGGWQGVPGPGLGTPLKLDWG